jgi:hypothetical protein
LNGLIGMIEFRDVQRDLQLNEEARDARYKLAQSLIPVVLCDQEGRSTDANGDPVNASVPGHDNYVFARSFGDSIPSQYLNVRGVPPLGGTPCFAGYASESLEIEILSINDANAKRDRKQLRDRHALEHQPGGYDPLNVYLRMLVPLRTTPITGLTVQVAPLVYSVSGTPTIFLGTNSLDLTSNVPASGLARYVLIYLNTSTNAIATSNGSTVVDSKTVIPPLPANPTNSIPSAYVRLAGDQTTIAEDDTRDARVLISDTTIDTHASTHINGDEIDGDKLDIDWNPSNYTPTATPSEADDVDDLTAHLAGIDSAISTIDQVKVSSDDTTADYLLNKLVGTAPITLTETSPGGDEDITVSVNAATESAQGVSEIATQTETDAGTDDTRIVTPLKLAAWPGVMRGFDVERTTSDQSISKATDTKIEFNLENIDTESDFDSATNYRHTPSIAGKWMYICGFRLTDGDTGGVSSVTAKLYLNGAQAAARTFPPSPAQGDALVTKILDMNGSTDYVEGYARYAGGPATSGIISDVQTSMFGVFLGA